MNASRFLTTADFAFLVRHAPLVSIDIIIKDPEERILVGFRTNEPAKGYYFVPGGIIRKNETIHEAFLRILEAETGLKDSLPEAKFLGVFEHIYKTNSFGQPDYGTHYIVLAHQLTFKRRPSIIKDSQHSEIRWMSTAEILSTTNVHPNTQAYFARAM
jgi:colanic acid biosynthesis protein WcaH